MMEMMESTSSSSSPTSSTTATNGTAAAAGLSTRRGGTDARGNVLAFTISDEEQLTRFLILGTEGGSFYCREQELTAENMQCVTRLIQSGQGELVVQKVLEVVSQGRCIRMNSALMVLALCCREEDGKIKSAAYKAVLEVCNIPTHLFKFLKFIKAFRGPGKTAGWGRGLRKMVTQWYNKFASNPQRLAMLVTKYRQREGWSHTDVLRLSHVKPVNDIVGFILRYTTKDLKDAKAYYMDDDSTDVHRPQLLQIMKYLEAVEEAKCLQAPKHPGVDEHGIMKGPFKPEEDRDVQRVVALVQQFDLVREHVPPPMLQFALVWESLVEKMPLMAMLRNLNRMTIAGVLNHTAVLNKVLDKLGNAEAMRQAKVHPYAILTAWRVYSYGRGMRGKLRWTPVHKLVKALDQAFYAAFGNVKPTNKRILIAVDCSASMGFCSSTGARGQATGVSAQDGAAAMSLVTARVESCVEVVGFSFNDLMTIPMKEDTTLEDTVGYMRFVPGGGTDCSQPMTWAKDNKKEFDAFIIYTDNETWNSTISPAEALREYRRESGIHDARLAVVAMESSRYSIADPQDMYMMDVVGFDVDTPTVLQEFIAGTLYE